MLRFVAMSTWNAKRRNDFFTRQQRWLALGVLVLVVILCARLIFQTDNDIPDFRQFPAGLERKTAFLTFMQPIIEHENLEVEQERERLLAIASDDRWGWLDKRRLDQFAEKYGLDASTLDDHALVDELLRRIDTVPMSLALAQAVKESGWGTSRFAREGNNIFGQWCFREGCGIVPRSRAPGATHEVESFASPRDAVQSYLRNINTHPNYEAFRTTRARMRAESRPLSGILLAGTMSKYSERREAYTSDLVQLIRTNDLEDTGGGD